MMTDNTRQVVFHHIPKTAGMSLRRYIEAAYAPKERYLINDQRNLWFQADEDLAKFRCIYGHVGFGLHRRLHSQRFTFLFLRDPLDRILSLYDFWRQLDHHHNEPHILRAKSQDLEAFFSEDCPAVMSETDNAMSWMLFCDKGIDVRGFHRARTDDEILSGAIEHLGDVDFIGFQERFDADVKQLCARLGWEHMKAERLNQTPSRQKADDLPHALRETLKQRLQLDYRLYERAMTLCDERQSVEFS